METIRLEISGYILKEELLKTVESSILASTQVLETVNPFNGYYSANPGEYVPRTVFLITQKEYKRDVIARMNQNIKNYLEIDFDADRAEVTLYNEPQHCIRIYDIQDYSKIELIQKAYQSEGIKFKTSTNKYEGISQIKIWKEFLLQDNGNGIYINLSKSKMFYFKLPKHMSCVHFQTLVSKVKNNWTGNDFDAALGFFYRKNGAQDVVRIFSNHITPEMIEELPQKFLRFIQ
mgnify:CR=1 FL=1